MGGDEFVALMFNADSVNCKKRLDEKRLSFLERPLEFDGHQISCNFSYGLVCFGTDGNDFESLIGKADQRMYEHKSRVKSS